MYLTQMRLDMNNHHTLSAISAPNKLHGALAVSYTHLDVYKRQVFLRNFIKIL